MTQVSRGDAEKFTTLRERLRALAPLSPALARQLQGVEIDSLRGRADLARIPLVRKSDLPAMQRAAPPFAGLAAAAPGRFKRLFVSPGPIFEAQDFGDDPWGAAAALKAAGFQSRRNRPQLLLLPPDAGRLHHGERRACAGLRDDPGRPRQYRTDLASHRAVAARRLLRAARLPQDSARQGAGLGRRRLVAAQGARLRRRPARQPARRAGRPRGQDAAGFRDRRARRRRLRDRRLRRRPCPGSANRRRHLARDRSARAAAIPSGSARSAKSSSPPCAETSRCSASPPATSPPCWMRRAFAAGWAARTRRRRSRACSCTRQRSSRSASATLNSGRCASSSGVRANRTR